MQTVNSYLKNKKKKENTNRYKMKTVNEIAKANKIDLSNLEVKQDTSGLFQDSKGGFLKTVGGTLGDLASDIGEGFLRAVEGTTDWAQYRISDYEKWLSKQQKKAFDKLGMEKVGNKISGLSKTASEKLINNAKVDSTGALFGKNENQNLFKKGWTNKLEENSILGDTADTINQGIGQIGAMVGMSHLGGTVLGGTNAVSGTATALNRANKMRKATSALTSYSSAYGNARSEAYKNGANDETANKTAMISGFSEAISEQFFDGIPGLKSQGWANNLTGKVAGSLEKSFGTKIGKTFMKVTDALGEGSEEIISNVLQATGNDIAHALDKNYNYGMENQTGNILKDSYNALTSEESLKSFFTAAMTSALVGSADTFLTTTQKNTIIKEYAKENDISFAEAKKQFETTINDETNAIAGNKSFNEKMDIQENIKRQELDNMKKGIFIEKGQRDQAFQYNETENEQVNNMLKSLSEKGNNTSENHATAKMAEKLIKDLGLNIEFTNSEELRAKGLPEADGYKEGNKLVLNLNSNKLTSYVMGHETTHFLENQGELYDAVSKAVFDLATTKGIHDGEVAKIKKLYANIIDNKVNEEMQNKGRTLTEQEINKITDDIVRSELTANYVGEFFTDEEFFRTLGKENPSILQKLAEFFDELLSKITGNTERQQIHEAKRKIKKVYAEYMNGSQINLENSQEVQMKNKGITEQKQQDNINIPTKQETTQKQEINKSSEVNLPTAEKIENKNKENAQKNENTVKKIEKTDNETKTTEENIPTKTKIDNEEGIKKIKEKYDTTEKVTGSKKTIVLSNGEKLSGTYKLIEAGNVSASHNAETFEKTEGFPTTENGTTVNDRDYQSDKNAQNLVTQKSDNFDGRAFADNGVIVTKDGIVVSGNDRTMSGDLAAKKGTDTAYIEYLKDNASQFGFTVEQIDNMKHPRVVFELNKKLPYDTKTFAMFNKDAKKSKSVSERAKEIGKTIDEDTINSVSEIIDNFDTIDDLYNNEKATRELISLMQAKNIIDSNDLSDIYNGSKFTGSGKDLVESVILGSVINEDNAKYFSNNNDLKFKVMKAAPALIQNKTLNDYSINELFNNAVEVYKKASSSKMTLDEFTSQSNIFGDNDVDLVTKRIAQLLETKGYKNLRNFIEKYNAMAEFPASGQTDIFSGGQVETKEDILRKALNIDDNTEIQYLISDRQYNINDFARRFAKANNYKNEISMDFISKAANAYAYGEYDPNYNYTNVDDIEDSKFANDLIEKIKFELDKKGYHLNELEDRFVKNDRQYMLNDNNIKDISTGYSNDEYYREMQYIQDGKVIGKLNYGEYDGIPSVKMLEVDSEFRRKGIGKKLLQELQKKYNGIEIDFGMTTPDGTSLLENTTYEIENKEVADKLKRIKEIQNKLDEYDEGYKNYYDNNLIPPQNYAEDYNELYDEKRKLEEETWNKKATKTFVKTDDKQYMLSDTDNQGRKLTKEQQEYFKNSKVVDEKGNLLTVYRGEPTKGKTEYIAKKGGGNKENNEYGIYFTNSKDFAKDFAFERIQDPNDIFFVKKGKEGELKESYLNITNPLNLGTISREEISNLYDYASDIGKLDGKETFINNMLNWQRIGNHQLMKMNLDMKKIADNTTYDGLIAKLNVQGDEIEYAVFNSNQIKDVDNTKPTTNADIRYMLSDKPLEQRVYGDELLNAQDLIEEVKNVGANVDNNGYITLYHVTNPESAKKIRESGKMFAKEDGIFFSTSKNAQQGEGRGGITLEFKIPAEKLILDDLFSDNADLKIPLNNKNEILDVSQYLVENNKQYMLKGDEMSGIYIPKNQFTNRLSDGLIQENLPTEEKTNLPTSNTNNEEENIFEKPTRRQVIDRNRQLAREQLGDITKIKDKKKGIMYQINTMKRNLRDIMTPEQAKSMYETYFRPITENNAKMEKDITSYNERIQKYNLNNEESVYTQMLGELRYNPDSELTSKEVNDYYNKNSKKIDAGKVDKAIEEFRSIYDELIGRVNQTLTANGYKEIEYRQGYFPHFIEEKATSPIGKFAEKLGWKVKSGQLPTDIAGITDQFKPGKTWTTFSQHRTGDATDYNALKGLDNYLRGAMDVIHHTNDIQKLRALENEIRYQYSEKGIKEKIDSIYADDTLDMEEKNDAIYTLTNNIRNSGLGNFATEIRNYTDNLANKKAFGDRSMEQQFGRDTYSIMQNINSRVSANMVGGNISSALTNFIPITQAWSQLSTKNLMKGMYESIKASIKDDGFANNSVYLTNRTKQADRLYKSGIDKINDKLGVPFEAIDSFTSNTIVRAKYHDNIEKGMSEQEAIRNADEFAKDVMAGRSKGDMPTIMNQKNPLMKLMTAFQLEVNNQYGYMFKDIPADLGDEAKRKLVGAFIKMFFGAWLYNQLSEKVTGRKSAFSPIDMAIDDIKTATNENLDLGDKISAIAEDTAQELPFVGGLLGGGRLPIQAAIPYENPLEMVTGTISDISKTFDEDESKKKNAIKKLMKEWSKPVYYVAMPFGGGQIKKTIEGLGMYDDNLPIAGSYTDSGKLRFEAPDDTLGKLQAAVFGQYASKNAREYFDNGYQPLTEKQINTALDAGLNINEYREYNSGIKAQENNNDKINYINNLPLENEQKNVLANEVLKRKEKVDISDYGNYGSLEEFDYANKNPGKYNAITQITDYDSYNEYKKKINEIKDQYEDTNERKQAVFSYINSLELNKYQKLMLQKLASGYSIKNYKREMQNYINSLELSAAEKQQIDDALFK
ncbi:MAG: hypothetical protein PUJ51_12595 [Clostridiales bacterium]|uniref:GNAT family N-acetyltransferase n=1 Tax=Terrisporobacter sp. TaxID=1965305 RepID=UPI002A4F309E|nr:GNAT family N-acetyltransferase [Terrisporobacter sp.]MDD7755325.1 hypothetical protein [Clostridiales bacterium]MDY4136324.1 hypothetical protein [Terrisporobacter sp.]